MKTTGRKSMAALTVVSEVNGITRIHAPSHLDAKIKSVWVRIVNSKPADWFGSEHADMLEALCRHIVQAQSISTMIDSFDISWALDDEGLKRLEKLHKMHSVQTDKINAFMRAMRLTHQSIYRADKAPLIDGSGTKKPWEVDED